ncbi:hypothetical protein K1X76_00920 [bacterium]|nr:hypothetical protein [bacterium]
MKFLSWITLFFFLSFNACVSYKPLYVRSSQNSALPSLDTQKEYRITTDNGKRVYTGMNGFKMEADQLIIQNRYSQETIPMTQITQIDQPKVNALKTSFLVGGLVITALGIVLGVTLADWQDSE